MTFSVSLFAAAFVRIGPIILVTGFGAGRALPFVVRVPLVVVLALFIAPMLRQDSPLTSHALVGAALALALGAIVLGASWTGRLLGASLGGATDSLSFLTESMLGAWLLAAGAPVALLAAATVPDVPLTFLRLAELPDAVLAGAVAFALPVAVASAGSELVIARLSIELAEYGDALRRMPIGTLLAISLTCAALASAVPWFGEAVISLPDWLLKSQQ